MPARAADPCSTRAEATVVELHWSAEMGLRARLSLWAETSIPYCGAGPRRAVQKRIAHHSAQPITFEVPIGPHNLGQSARDMLFALLCLALAVTLAICHRLLKGEAARIQVGLVTQARDNALSADYPALPKPSLADQCDRKHRS